MIREGKFREDLFYRLNVFPIEIPPLRERRDDIPLLVNYFVTKLSRQMGKTITSIPKEKMDVLTNWPWPGNVRELANFIERAVILSQGTTLNVPLGEFRWHSAAMPVRESIQTLAASEREIILRALRDANGVVAAAAGKLGMKRTTLNSKMRKLQIGRGDLFAN
jgi:transcriptional regulator with GAF, ATPase, and Fis domain